MDPLNHGVRNVKETNARQGYVGVEGLSPELMFSVSGTAAVSVFAGDNRFKSVGVGGGPRGTGDNTPSEMISILIGRPNNNK